jgi:hypothetical protein
MMRNKTHLLKMKQLREEWLDQLGSQKEADQHRVDIEYQLAVSDLRAEIRTWIVNFNYDIFHSDQSFIRHKVYQHLSEGLAKFHEMAKTKRH